jgi:cbb3-type cytochrome oxidase cytochrome c subunit
MENELTVIVQFRDELERELAVLLREATRLDRKLKLIDPDQMTTGNKIASMIRDLPVLDFMAPSIKINQIVVKDIRDDVNFTTVPKVDRCTTCHLGIDKVGYEAAPQPFTTHPNLELYLTSSSPHPINDYGCTSCHAGRGRGTSFTSSGHMPSTPEQAHEWEEKYAWESLDFWETKMYPAKYSEAGCLKCHTGDAVVKAADKLNLGLSLMEKGACYGCHQLDRYDDWERRGPNLAMVSSKLTREFSFKWIREPRDFRHNAWMPSFFGQSNTDDEKAIKRTNTEIHGIVHYLFENSTDAVFATEGKLGDPVRGKQLVESLGCLGCHVVEHEPTDAVNSLDRMNRRHGPNLINIGSKTDARWTYNWIKDPTFYNPISRMPDLRLSDDEAGDITAYLLSSRNVEFENTDIPPLDEEELDAIAIGWLAKSNPTATAIEQVQNMEIDEKLEYVGEKSILLYGCFSCHNLPGFETAKPIGTPLTYEGSKPVHNLDFGSIHDIGHTNYNWFEAKLANPRIFDRKTVKAADEKLRMPNFHFSQVEVEALVTALLGLVKADIGESKMANYDTGGKIIQRGRIVIEDFNCQGCHIIDGYGGSIANIIGDIALSPPTLNTEGAKVQPNWLFHFFKEPEIIRPNLTVRMPTFAFSDETWNNIIKSFQYADNVTTTFEDQHVVAKDSDLFSVGTFLASADVGDCGKCHILGSKNPTGNRIDWAPDLAKVRYRLRPDWVVDFLRDPQEIMPGTKMPQPYVPTKEDVDFEGAEEYFPLPVIRMAGETEKLLQGLRDYVYTVE